VCDVVVSGVCRMNEVNPRRARLVPGPGDRLRAGIPSRYVTSQLVVNSALHPSGVVNRKPALAGEKGGNVTSAEWQVTRCDSIWQVTSRNGEDRCVRFPYLVHKGRGYVTIMRTYTNVRSNADINQLNLPHETKNQKSGKKRKLNSKNRICAEVSVNSPGSPRIQS